MQAGKLAVAVLAAVLAGGHLSATRSTQKPLQPAPQRPDAPPTGTAQISGIVKNAADDKPLARARVVATSDVLREPRDFRFETDARFVAGRRLDLRQRVDAGVKIERNLLAEKIEGSVRAIATPLRLEQRILGGVPQLA